MKPTEFIINETIGKTISKYVRDIKTDRKGDRFVFPTFAKNDTELPQITIEVEGPTFVDVSASNYLQSETLANGDYKEYYYKKAIYPVKIFCMTVRGIEYEVIYDNKKAFMGNKMICDYWSHDVMQQLRIHRDELLLNFDDFKIEGKPESYEASKVRWTAQIDCVVTIKELWVHEYHNGELIRDYTVSTTIN